MFGDPPRGREARRILGLRGARQGAAGAAAAAAAGPAPVVLAGGRDGAEGAGAPSGHARGAVAVWRGAGERQAYEDIMWSLVSSAEFIYNH
jgi:hypothetical protein